MSAVDDRRYLYKVLLRRRGGVAREGYLYFGLRYDNFHDLLDPSFSVIPGLAAAPSWTDAEFTRWLTQYADIWERVDPDFFIDEGL